MKQKLTLLFAVLCNACFIIAANYSGSCGDKLHWELNTEDSTLVITGSGAMKNWEYTSTIPWYQYRSYIVHVSLPSNLTSIGDRAFTQCASLRDITIPQYVTSIGNYSFSGCNSLALIVIPSSVTSFGMSAFASCTSLITINIPNSVTTIGQSAFYNCVSLEGIVIPKSVTSIGTSAFSSCLAMTSIHVDLQNSVYCSIDGVLFDKAATKIIQYPIGNVSPSYTIPESVVEIGSFAFEECINIRSIQIPNTVTTIGRMAFYSCDSLKTITIGNGVTSIGEDVFGKCTSLAQINVDETNTKYSSINGVLYNKDGTHLIMYPIRHADTSYIIPYTVSKISEGAFDRCIYLTALTCEAQTPPILLGSVFYGVDKSIPLYVPAESISAYKSAEQWKDFMNILPIPEDPTGLAGETKEGYDHYCSRKIFNNGQLLILRDGKTYTVQGLEVK